MPGEPIITINGHQLSEGEAMTIRVALESFADSLVTDGLGNDEIGVLMTKAYLTSIHALRTKIRKARVVEYVDGWQFKE